MKQEVWCLSGITTRWQKKLACPCNDFVIMTVTIIIIGGALSVMITRDTLVEGFGNFDLRRFFNKLWKCTKWQWWCCIPECRIKIDVDICSRQMRAHRALASSTHKKTAKCLCNFLFLLLVHVRVQGYCVPFSHVTEPQGQAHNVIRLVHPWGMSVLAYLTSCLCRAVAWPLLLVVQLACCMQSKLLCGTFHEACAGK